MWTEDCSTMRILFVLENYLPHIGGVEVVFSQLAEAMAKEGNEVVVLTHRLKDTAKKETINGVKIERVSCLGSRYLFSLLAIPRAIELAKWADIVHSTTFNGAPPAWVAGKLRGKPVILTVHEVWVKFWSKLTDMNWPSRKFHSLAERLLYFLPFDRYVAVSDFTARDLAAYVPKEKIIRIYNALDYSLFDQKKYSKAQSRKKLKLGSEFIYFAYGRPGVSKGFEYLIDAASTIAKKVPHARLLLMLSKDAAYDKRFKQLRKHAENNNALGPITFLEPVKRNELPLYLSAMDCVVIPSLREGFGFGVAEPCALGVPVVASNASSIPEVISGKYHLVPAADSIALAQAIIAVSKGKTTKKPLKKFLLADNIKQYRQLYSRILKK